jgi:hypothetical protein
LTLFATAGEGVTSNKIITQHTKDLEAAIEKGGHFAVAPAKRIANNITNQCIIENFQQIIVKTLYKRLTRLQILLLISLRIIMLQKQVKIIVSGAL